jgi:N-methylhydantoinase A
MQEVFAVDVGGTFTDLVLLDPVTGDVQLTKSPTTPQAPSEGVLRAIEKVGLDLGEARFFFHGTTLGINTLLEHKGAKVGLITTAGFRDVLEIGRLQWPMYRLHWEQPPPFIPRSLRHEVAERVRADGTVITALDDGAVRAAIDALVAEGVESVAVCFLHSYAFPDHERRVGAILTESYPDIDFTLSHQLTQEYREWERSMTAAVNASIKRRMATYLGNLESSLQGGGFEGEFLVTRCDGGVMSAAEAKDESVRTLISGPASGVMGASTLARSMGIENLITIDMGGTSLDAALVIDGQPSLSASTRVEGFPLLVPVVDLTAIGAGGGSIAWIDEGGALNVGPQSAGAEPGPICYGKGGEEPTFTDAALVTGLIDPQYFLGGEIALDREAARAGIDAKVGAPLGLDTDEAASGIVALVEAKMAATLEEITIGKGHDPRDFALLAYGGGGSLVACPLASRLDIPKVIIPRSPATFSAWGMLTLDIVFDVARTRPTTLDALDAAGPAEVFSELEAKAIESLDRQGVEPERRQLLRSLDMRYENQEHALNIPVGGDSTTEDLAALRTRFDEQHQSTYGYTTADAVEVVTYRVRAVGEMDKPRQAPIPRGGDIEPSRKGSRRALHRESGGEFDWAVFERDGLGAGSVIAGPAIVEEPTATTLVPPGWQAEVDDVGNLVITSGGQR